MSDFSSNPRTLPTPVHPTRAPGKLSADADRPQQAPSRRSPRSGRHHHSRRSSSSRRKIRTLSLLLGLMFVLSVVSTTTAVLYYNKYHGQLGKVLALDLARRNLREQLTATRDNVTRLNNDLRILLSNRIPGVADIQLNRQLEVNDRYFRSLTLSRSGVGDQGGLEFHAVLQNQRPDPVLPNASILLFDAKGLQAGSVDLSSEQSITPVAGPELHPQETRTYSGKLKLFRSAQPRYFLVEVR